MKDGFKIHPRRQNFMEIVDEIDDNNNNNNNNNSNNNKNNNNKVEKNSNAVSFLHLHPSRHVKHEGLYICLAMIR